MLTRSMPQCTGAGSWRATARARTVIAPIVFGAGVGVVGAVTSGESLRPLLLAVVPPAARTLRVLTSPLFTACAAASSMAARRVKKYRRASCIRRVRLTARGAPGAGSTPPRPVDALIPSRGASDSDRRLQQQIDKDHLAGIARPIAPLETTINLSLNGPAFN